MSTRCEIMIKSQLGEVKLYHHHDGYIEGVGFDLYKRFFANNGMLANEYMHINACDIANKLIKDSNDEYELTLYLHTDIEYYYEIDVDRKTLSGCQVRYNNDYTLETIRQYDLNDIEKMYEGEV